MKKVFVLMLLSVTFMFAAMNLNTASKKELMEIKGIGEVKALQIIEYRQKNKIKNVEELSTIKGFGPALISNIKKEKKVKINQMKNTQKKKKTKE
ncbi:MAG: helix-hairpin-helix domain-containing protein [Halarcobacter sp.]